MKSRSRQMQIRILKTLTIATTIISAIVIIATIAGSEGVDTNRLVLFGILMTVSLLVFIRLRFDPDQIRAEQSNAVLNLASRMLAAMNDGLNLESAQKICRMLLSTTSAIAVAITDRKNILGYAGEGEKYNELGTPIRTVATRATIADGKMRVLYDSKSIGFPVDHNVIHAAILVPLVRAGETIGTLKFYFPHPRCINETQQSIAAGFGELLTTQLASIELDKQKKLATSMELKALQAQINPHFLFNTLNTIASFTHSDPARARSLLREFSKFYRDTLENASDLIPLWREITQTQRYLTFEIARFGEDRLELVIDVPESLTEVLVPAFAIQPLVENAVKHAMPARGKLTITVSAKALSNDLLLEISDDGIGMDDEKLGAILNPNSKAGLGIAVRNIHDRVRGYYGGYSNMTVDSTTNEGTRISLLLDDGCLRTTPPATVQGNISTSDD